MNELLLARAELRVPKLLRFYGSFDLVMVDELGYVPFNREAAQLLFEFFSDRYETRATALTTNLPFAQWTQVFGDETMSVALLDRLTHRSHVLDGKFLVSSSDDGLSAEDIAPGKWDASRGTRASVAGRLVIFAGPSGASIVASMPALSPAPPLPSAKRSLIMVEASRCRLW